MRIASYNIMSGGFDSYNTAAVIPERLPLLQKAIKKLDADIIGLIDTFRWDELYTESEIAELFDYKYCYCINLNDERLKELGHNNGITLLSNIQIEPRTINLGSRDAILARISDPYLHFDLAVVYLDDMSEEERLKQIQALHSQLNLETPVVAMGDFNSIDNAEREHVEIAFKHFTKNNPEIGGKFRPIIDDMLQGKVIATLKSWGLHDAGTKQYLPTMPTPLFPAPIQKPFLRLDYCFYTPALSVSKLQVHDDELFQLASDHFPISFLVE